MSQPVHDSSKIRWLSSGDVNGFLGLMVDNLTVMAIMAGILVGAFGFPAEIVFTKMFPGTALGVLFGDLVYTYMGYKLARKEGRADVTAMPLGLDTPSSIGIVLTVLGPAFLSYKASLPEDQAALMTWYLGMATMVNIGIIKLVFSFAGKWLQSRIPLAGLLGSLAGIGIALIGFMPMVKIFKLPLAGMVSLGLILYTLVAGLKLPKRIPGVAAAVVLGTVVYYLTGGHFQATGLQGGGLPLPSLDFLKAYRDSLDYLPLAFPFAMLTVIGGVNVTESARVAGDDFDTRKILLVEAFATLLAGLCGGVAQSTPYIGQPAYKAMGARLGYTAMTGIFVGLGGIIGYLGFFTKLIPEAVLAPILVFVALDIVVQAFQASPARHAPAVALAFIPTIARLVAIQIDQLGMHLGKAMPDLLKPTPEGISDIQVTISLGNGFILTAMLWGGCIAELIDRKVARASMYLFVLAGLSLPGIIHSALASGKMYNPASLTPELALVPYHFAGGYLLLGIIFLALSFTPESKEPPDESAGHGGHFG